MGIQRGSLYGAFGDKQQLFLEAFDRYEERFRVDMIRVLHEAPSAKEGIRQVFEQVLHDCACGDQSKGCFITNTAVALAEGDEEAARRVRANLGHVEDAFAVNLERAQSRGEIAERFSPRALARFFTNALQGLRVLSKCCVEYDVLADSVEISLSLLDEPISKETHSNERRPN